MLFVCSSRPTRKALARPISHAFYHQLSSLVTPNHRAMLNEVKTKPSNLIQEIERRTESKIRSKDATSHQSKTKRPRPNPRNNKWLVLIMNNTIKCCTMYHGWGELGLDNQIEHRKVPTSHQNRWVSSTLVG